MIVSAKGRYALRVMIVLAARGKGEPVPLKELSDEEDIPHKFLEQIMTELAKAGLVESARGKNGGYRLTRPASDYTAAEILRVTETSFAAASCTAEEADCPRAEKCPTLPLWQALDDAVDGVLKKYTLEDLSKGVTLP